MKVVLVIVGILLALWLLGAFSGGHAVCNDNVQQCDSHDPFV